MSSSPVPSASDPPSGGAAGEPLPEEEAFADAFFEEPGFQIRLRLPLDLDRWLPWTGAAVIAIGAFETLAQLVSGTLGGWNGTTPAGTPFPRPDGYYSLLLLAGVLLLALRRGRADDRRWIRWLRGVACLAAGTGGALLTTQLASIVETLRQPPGSPLEATTVTWTRDVAAIGSAGDALLAAAAAGVAVLLYGWSHRPERTAGRGAAARPATSGAACGAAGAADRGGSRRRVPALVSTRHPAGSAGRRRGSDLQRTADCRSQSRGQRVLALPSDCSTPSPGQIECPMASSAAHPIDCQSSPRVGLIQCVAYAGYTCPETNQGAVCRYSQSIASPGPSGTPTGCKVTAQGPVHCPPRASPTP